MLEPDQLERADSHANLEVVIPNGSRFCFSKEIVAKSIHDKNLDISITMIEKEWYPGFIGTRPVPLDDNLPDFNQSDLEVRLLFFGYPATRASLAAKTRTLVANPILYTSNEVEPPHDSRVYGEVRDFHIISDFNHKKVRNSKHPGMQWQAPNLEGMSGCPILKCHVRIVNNEDTPVGPIEFVGIATDKDKNKWLKGVKKEYIQNLLVSF